MFPVFTFKPVANNQTNIGVAGTAFFVNADGYFVTAAHVMADPAATYQYLGRLPEDLASPSRVLVEIARDAGADLLVGRVDVDHHEFAHILKAQVPLGRSVMIAGYPLPTITTNSAGGSRDSCGLPSARRRSVRHERRSGRGPGWLRGWSPGCGNRSPGEHQPRRSRDQRRERAGNRK
jgi:hypothetical protein